MDVYWKLRGPGVTDHVAAWWLLNCTREPYARWRVTPDQWDQCMDWVCVGWRHQEYFDHVLKPCGGIEALRGVNFLPLDPEAVEGMRRGLLPQYLPGMPSPIATPWDVQAYWQFLRERNGNGKGKGKGKGMLKGPARL